MSYDVSMVIDTGGLKPAEVCDCGNYTYNVSPMFYKALDGGLNGLHGVSGEDAAPRLLAAINYMKDTAAEMKLLNPENGWGNYEGAMKYLGDIVDGCLSHPKAKVDVS